MDRDNQKLEIQKYVSALETNYTDHIRDLKDQIERDKIKQKKANFEKVAETC